MNKLSLALSLQTRITSVSLVFIAGLITIGLVTAEGDRAIAARFAEHEELGRVGAAVRKIGAEALALKVASRDFRFRRSTTDGDVTLSLHAVLADSVSAASTKLTAQGFGPQLAEVSGDVTEIGARFRPVSGRLAAGLEGSDASLQHAGTQLEGLARAVALGSDDPGRLRMLTAALGLRRAEADFRNSLNNTHLAQWEVELGRIERAIALASFDGADQRDTVAAALQSYSKSFPQWSDSEKSFADEAEKLTDAVDILTPKLFALERAIEPREAAAAGELARVQARMKFTVFSTIIVVLAIGSALSLFVARTTSRPIRQLRDTMLSLAKGDSTRPIPSTERADEIGQMARAVLVFKDTADERLKLAGAHAATQDNLAARSIIIDRLIKRFDDSARTVLLNVESVAKELSAASVELEGCSSSVLDQADAAGESSKSAGLHIAGVASASDQLRDCLRMG